MGLLGPTGALVIHTGETTQEKTFKYFYMAIDLNVKGKKCTNVLLLPVWENICSLSSTSV